MAVGTTVLALTLVSACASTPRDAAETVNATDPATPTGSPLLAAFATGIGAVATGATEPLWLETNAVAALDGTSVFVIRPEGADAADHLVRLDPESGAVMATWELGPSSGLFVAAVAPKARWVALTDRKPGYGSQGRTQTNIVVFDTSVGTPAHKLTLTGDVQPEAFSTDGSLLFVLNHFPDHYRVQTIVLASGDRVDTRDRDKRLSPEDMEGRAVHGVMSKDRTLLATLYRNSADADEPAFVHVLDLQHGWSYCADLPAPFGTGPVGTDVIQLTGTGTVVVAATEASRLAEIHIDDVRTPVLAENSRPVRVAYRDGTITQPDDAFRSIPNFEFLITEPTA
jgi:hypothetical protein